MDAGKKTWKLIKHTNLGFTCISIIKILVKKIQFHDITAFITIPSNFNHMVFICGDVIDHFNFQLKI